MYNKTCVIYICYHKMKNKIAVVYISTDPICLEKKVFIEFNVDLC